MTKKQPTGLPFDGYVRVSRVNGRSGESYRSPEDQKATIARLALAHGLKVGEVVTEEDVSGGKKAADRELGRLVQKVLDGESGGIVVWKVSRFSRNLVDGITTIGSITEAGGRVIGEDLDTAQPMGKALLGLMLGLAEEELDARRAGWKRATDGAIHRGVVVGPTPVGYDRLPDGRIRKNDDADAVKAVFIGRAQGRSWAQLANGLEAAGVEPSEYRYARENIEQAREKAKRTHDKGNLALVARYEKTLERGAGWHINSVRSLVRQTVYYGMLKNGIEHHFPAYAIVTRGEWDSAQEHFQNGLAPRRARGEWALLAGVCFCGECGGPMTPQRDVKKTGVGEREYRAYRCQNRKCPRTTGKQVRADGYELDAMVAEIALQEFARRISVMGVGRDEDTEQVVTLEREVTLAEDELASYLAVARATDAGFAQAVEMRRADVEAAKAALADEQAKTRRFPTVDEVEAVLADGDIEAKREAIRRVVVEVKVNAQGTRLKDEHRSDEIDFTAPAPGPDAYEPSTALADRVETVWS